MAFGKLGRSLLLYSEQFLLQKWCLLFEHMTHVQLVVLTKKTESLKPTTEV